jgi:uncharacterized cupin superfamily protein
MRRVNLNQTEAEYDESDPEGYRAGAARLGPALGSEELGINLFEIPAGEDLCPYHYEYVEEWLLVLSGNVTIRTPEGEEEVGAGELVRFPAGPEGAHKTMNRSQAPVRMIMFSSSREPSVAVYPDSDKVGIWTPNPDDKWMFRGAEAHLQYYDGEA